MNQIKFMTMDETKIFEIPWEWIEKRGLKPKKNDLESVAKRGKLNGRLYRKRQAQIPDYTLQFVKSLYRFQIKDLIDIIKQEQIKVYFFEHFKGQFVTKDFYVPPPELPVDRVPYDNDTDNILYAPISLEFISYGDVS